MDYILHKMSEEYIRTVENICLLMLKGLNLSTREELINYGFKNQIGRFYLEKENLFMFHGIGCEFKNDKIKIDWDFGVDNKWCGIDPWKFYSYLKENRKKEKVIFDIEYIKKEYEKSVINGEMVKKSGLYYFKT